MHEELELGKADQKRQELIRILNSEPAQRNDEEVSLIQSIFEDNKFLKQFKGTPKLKELCKHLKVELYDEGQTIIQEGEYGETFYIIYTGRVTILKFKKNEITGMINMVSHLCQFHIMKVPLAELTSGDSFGELALLQKAPR